MREQMDAGKQSVGHVTCHLSKSIRSREDAGICLIYHTFILIASKWKIYPSEPADSLFIRYNFKICEHIG